MELLNRIKQFFQGEPRETDEFEEQLEALRDGRRQPKPKRKQEEGRYPLSSSLKAWDISELTEKFVAEARLVTADGEPSGANKTTLNFMELGMDMISFAQRSFKVELTLTETDIYQVEEMAAEAHQARQAGTMDEEQVLIFAKLLAGYLGLLIGIHKGGSWVASVDTMPDAGPAIRQKDGKHYFVLGKVVRRIQNGESNNLVFFYQSIPYLRPEPDEETQGFPQEEAEPSLLDEDRQAQ